MTGWANQRRHTATSVRQSGLQRPATRTNPHR